MATTTTNFGWDIPQSTDLVKDGATAIAALGQDIDTALVDLKGGTTGQVLAKASGTDLDYSWVTTDDANAIQNAIVDAKGDLISATGNDTPARLAVGNNGETLVADSSTSTGLRYQGTMAAGKNAVINGGLDIWQRGTSIAGVVTNFVYTADRWAMYLNSGTVTASQETSVVPAGSQYALKLTSSATSQVSCYQAIETLNAIRYAGQTITFSNQFAATTSIPLTLQVAYSTSTDVTNAGSWTVITATSGGTVTPTSTTYVTGSGVYAIPSTAKSLRVGFYSTGTFATANSIYFGQSQFEIGSVATAFTRAGGTIQGELAACMRYFQTNGDYNYFGAFFTTTAARFYYTMPVTMRGTPTPTFPSAPYTNNVDIVGVGSATPTAVANNTANTKSFSFDATGMTGGVVSVAAVWRGSAITLSAEL